MKTDFTAQSFVIRSSKEMKKKGVLAFFEGWFVGSIAFLLFISYLGTIFHMVLVEHRWNALLEKLTHTHNIRKIPHKHAHFDKDELSYQHSISLPYSFVQEDPCLANLNRRHKYLFLSSRFTFYVLSDEPSYCLFEVHSFSSIVRYRLAPKMSPPIVFIRVF